MDPIIGPVLAQVGLTIFVLGWLAYSRFSYIGKHGFEKVLKSGFPERAINASDNLKHQFEMPVLFFVLALLFVGPLETTPAVLALAWAFFGLRVIHALIQLTVNIIFPWRFGVFILSTVCLIALFIIALLQFAAS